MKIYKALALDLTARHIERYGVSALQGSTALVGSWTRSKKVANAFRGRGGGVILIADIDPKEIARIPKRLAGAISNRVYSPWHHPAKFKRLKKDFPYVGALDVGGGIGSFGAFKAEQEIFVLRVSALQNVRILRENRRNRRNRWSDDARQNFVDEMLPQMKNQPVRTYDDGSAIVVLLDKKGTHAKVHMSRSPDRMMGTPVAYAWVQGEKIGDPAEAAAALDAYVDAGGRKNPRNARPRRRNGWRGEIYAKLDALVSPEDLEAALIEGLGWDDEGLAVYEAPGGEIIVKGQIKVMSPFYPGPLGKTETLTEELQTAMEHAGDETGEILKIRFTDRHPLRHPHGRGGW